MVPRGGLGALLEAELADEGVLFRRYGYAASALRHAVVDYPLARSDLLAWLAALPAEHAIPEELHGRLAETFADMAAEYGTAGLITETAYTWAKDGRADLAFIALSRTCLHPRVGGAVRRTLYEWSRTTSLPQTLKLTIARVCEVLGQTYPSVALTRLKHLATRGNGQVRNEVISAALTLHRSGHRAEVTAAALAWCARSPWERLSFPEWQRRRRSGAILFLELARPATDQGVPLIMVQDRFISPVPGWQAVLDVRATGFNVGDALEDVARRWLDAALRNPHVRRRIVGCFVQAATPPVAVPAGPYGSGPESPKLAPARVMIDVTRRWAAADRTDPIRREIRDDIVIPLTRPWWLRVLKAFYVRLRDRVMAALPSD